MNDLANHGAALLKTVALSLLSVNVSAHHSVTPYDENTFAELEGVLTEVRWRNPHLGMTLLVQSQGGVEREWELEGDSIMLREVLSVTQ